MPSGYLPDPPVLARGDARACPQTLTKLSHKLSTSLLPISPIHHSHVRVCVCAADSSTAPVVRPELLHLPRDPTLGLHFVSSASS